MLETRRDPRERLADLRRDMAATRITIREALDELAQRHGIAERDVAYAMDGYADNLLSDTVYSIERDIEHEIEEATPP
jgi:hypothetical protein